MNRRDTGVFNSNSSNREWERLLDEPAAPETTLSLLDFYMEQFRVNYECMCAGYPYSESLMDTAFAVISDIAASDAEHERYAETDEAERQAAECATYEFLNDDPRTPEQRAADDDWQDWHDTHNSLLP